MDQSIEKTWDSLSENFFAELGSFEESRDEYMEQSLYESFPSEVMEQSDCYDYADPLGTATNTLNYPSSSNHRTNPTEAVSNYQSLTLISDAPASSLPPISFFPQVSNQLREEENQQSYDNATNFTTTQDPYTISGGLVYQNLTSTTSSKNFLFSCLTDGLV